MYFLLPLLLSAVSSCRDDPRGADWVTVTLANGKACTLKNWSFEYTDAFKPPVKIDGIRVTIPFSRKYDTKRDSVLRIYGPDGERLELQRSELRELRVQSDCSGTPGSCSVTRMFLDAVGRDTMILEPVGPSGNKRAIMPMADYYWPDHRHGDYREFDGVGVKIKGTPDPGCLPFVGLSSVSHGSDSAPAKIEFRAP